MTERSEDWNVGLTQDLQDDEFVREFVTAAIEEGVPLKAVLLKLSAANRADLAMALWESLSGRSGTPRSISATNKEPNWIAVGRSISRIQNRRFPGARFAENCATTGN